MGQRFTELFCVFTLQNAFSSMIFTDHRELIDQKTIDIPSMLEELTDSDDR
jgi:hypothetical protein